MSGAPPPDHDGRCEAKSSRTGERCRGWAVKGRPYCRFHGGKAPLVSERGLPKIYRDKLGPTMRSRFEELCTQPHADQVQLYEELNIMRLAAEQVVQMAFAVFEANGEVSIATKTAAVAAVREAMGGVKDLAVAVSRIEQESKDTLSLRAVSMMVSQIMRVIHNVLGDEHNPMIEEIDRRLQSIRLPMLAAQGPAGTSITPDQSVKEMDGTVGGDQ